MTPWLTKSDFKAATDCPTKLYYKKHKYPSTNDEDPYMDLLADGGYMVGRMAQLLFPDGLLIEEIDPTAAIEATTRALAAGKKTLFEAAIEWRGCLVRADVLRFGEGEIELIEVKSKGYDRNDGFVGVRGGIRAEWLEYIQDVTFQRWVIRNAFPRLKVRSFLLTPDKMIQSPLDGLPSMFALQREGKRVVTVDFRGDAAAIRASGLLGMWPVDAVADAAEPEVISIANVLLGYLHGGLRRAPGELGYKCKACQYRVSAPLSPNGFNECWGKLADVEPSIFDLTHLGSVKSGSELLAERLIRDSKVSLYDIPLSALKGAHSGRQRIQIEFTRKSSEWRSDQLMSGLECLKYPLHFIDFETSRLALPYHAGMRPWEQVAFQWSCHTIDRPGDELRHSEWINLEDGFPSVAFAETLRAILNDDGTIFTWSHHEATTLKDIARQIDDYGVRKPELKQWLLNTVASGRMFDLCKHAQQHFFAPAMKGSASIKAVLPAVWRSSTKLRSNPWFARFVREDNEVIADPYEALPKIEIFEKAEVVDEGTGAMRAYQEMLYGAGRNDRAARAAWRALLLQYCALDTLAMVMIWKHWIDP